MIVDISNLDNMIRGYIVNTIRQYYPDIDTSENSTFDDLYIKPLVEFSRPFIDSLSRLELKSNLANAKYLTDSELDELGEGNYFTERKQGTTASTSVTLTFSNLNIEDEDLAIKIPTGAIFATGSGLEFQTQTTTVLRPDDLRDNYNKQKLVYEIDIPVAATDIGVKYNVFAGEIIFCKTFFSNSLVSSVNQTDVVDGRDKEDNDSYVKRIRDFYMSRQLGTGPGYRRFVMDLFDEINDVYVSGYRDPYMERDIVKLWDENADEGFTEKHIGGAVDLYLKGCIYDDNLQQTKLNNRILVLDCKIGELANQDDLASNIKLFNLTDASKMPVVEKIERIREEEYGQFLKDKVKVTIGNDGECSYTENSLSSMKIIYSFFSPGVENRIDQEEYFEIGLTEMEIASPVKSIDTLKDVNDNIIKGMEKRITVIKTGIEETTDEKCKVKIDNCEDFFNGTIIKIGYTSNKTLRQLKDILYDKQNRIITADVIAREASPVPVNVSFRVKPVNTYKDIDTKLIESRIKASIISYFNTYRLGDSVEESDLVGWLYTDASTNEMIQYIALPFDAFYIPKSIDEEIPTDGSQVSPDGVLPIESIEYPVLNAGKFKVVVI